MMSLASNVQQTTKLALGVFSRITGKPVLGVCSLLGLSPASGLSPGDRSVPAQSSIDPQNFPSLAVGDRFVPSLAVGDHFIPSLAVGDCFIPSLTVGDCFVPSLTVGDRFVPSLAVGDRFVPSLAVGDRFVRCRRQAQAAASLSAASCVGMVSVDGGGLLERALASMLLPPPTSNSPRFGPRLRELHEDTRLRTRRRVGGCPEKSTTRALSGLTSLNLTSTLA